MQAEKPVSAEGAAVEVDLVTYVCPRCGKKYQREEHVPVDPAEQKKLFLTIGGGVVFLLLVWVWVFQWGVPLVQQLTKE